MSSFFSYVRVKTEKLTQNADAGRNASDPSIDPFVKLYKIKIDKKEDVGL